MKRPLLIAGVAMLVSGANVALARTPQQPEAFGCSQQSCEEEDPCESLGCDGCTDFPVGFRCYNNEVEN